MCSTEKQCQETQQKDANQKAQTILPNSDIIHRLVSVSASRIPPGPTLGQPDPFLVALGPLPGGLPNPQNLTQKPLNWTPDLARIYQNLYIFLIFLVLKSFKGQSDKLNSKEAAPHSAGPGQ